MYAKCNMILYSEDDSGNPVSVMFQNACAYCENITNSTSGTIRADVVVYSTSDKSDVVYRGVGIGFLENNDYSLAELSILRSWPENSPEVVVSNITIVT